MQSAPQLSSSQYHESLSPQVPQRQPSHLIAQPQPHENQPPIPQRHASSHLPQPPTRHFSSELPPTQNQAYVPQLTQDQINTNANLEKNRQMKELWKLEVEKRKLELQQQTGK